MYFNFYVNIFSAVLTFVAYLTMPDDLGKKYIKQRKSWEQSCNVDKKKKVPLMRYLDHRIEHTPMGGLGPMAYPAMKFEFVPGYVKQKTQKPRK